MKNLWRDRVLIHWKEWELLEERTDLNEQRSRCVNGQLERFETSKTSKNERERARTTIIYIYI